MWIRVNPNPLGRNKPDCVIRALCVALKRSWYDIYDDLCALGREEATWGNDDHVWGRYLYEMGFEPFLLPSHCPRCITIRNFTHLYPEGTYIIGTGSHAVAVIDGNYYDSWDSGDEVPSFFWVIRR